MAYEQAGEETLTRSRSRSTDNNDRLEPHLLRAAENDDVDRLREIVDVARERKQLSDNFLRIGLMRSSEKGKVGATHYLLSQGAEPDGGTGNRLSPLLRAVERNQIAIVQLLLGHGANRETRDKKGRTPLMTAAWQNHWHILNMLISRGADVNGKDKKGRNVLHNLAADKQCNWGDEVIQLLLDQNIPIDGKEGQDLLQRSPLHWACATGKFRLAQQLLSRSKGPPAQVDAIECREKTSLHLACAHDKKPEDIGERHDIVELLLRNGADVNARSDGGWMPLHNACEKGLAVIVGILLEAGADVNAKLLNGISPLHLAAQAGHLDVVKYLMNRDGIRRAARDSWGFTPFLRAAQKKHREVSKLLAPFNQLENLSEYALGACNGFSATIVDFGHFRNDNRVKKQTIYELLYARDPQNPLKQAHSILPTEKASDFRWIHLPANNMAWVEALLTKAFIEEGSNDIEGFKALEKSFSNQHRGQQSHSHFMRPLCQSTPRASAVKEETEAEESAAEQPIPAIVVNGSEAPAAPQNGGPMPTSRRPNSKDGRADGAKMPQPSGKENAKVDQKEKGKRVLSKGNKPPKAGTETPTKHHHRKRSHPLESKHSYPPTSPSRKDNMQVAKCNNIFTFMPYLHFETNRRRQEMQEAIKAAENLPRPGIRRPSTYDEMLIRAHLATSTVSLHVRRTLDQSFYHNIDTCSRDDDQVVYRYQLRGKDPEDPDWDPKIVMVDQLWMWILGKDLVITAFPQRWRQPKDDPLNVLDSIIEDVNSKTRDAPKSVYDLAMIITNRCSGVFNRHRMGEDEFQLLDMFESSIGNATDRETILFKEFNAASAQASAWLHQRRKPNRVSRYLENSATAHGEELADSEERFKFEEFMRGPQFLDLLLDIGQETDLLAETKDIRDELNMISKVLEDQEQVLPDLQEAVCDIYYNEQVSQRDVKKRFEEQLKAIKTHLKDIDRMDKQAKRIYDSITDMLDLKQKHANAYEARFARDQADGTARQSQTIMVFTIVTIVFLPMSFIAAFFAINITEFPRAADGTSQSLPLAYVSKYMFGVGFAISIPLIMVALLYDDIGALLRVFKRKFKSKMGVEDAGFGVGGEGAISMHTVQMEQVFSVAQSRRSHASWERPMSRDTAGSVIRVIERAPTGFRLVRVSEDVERGVGERRL